MCCLRIGIKALKQKLLDWLPPAHGCRCYFAFRMALKCSCSVCTGRSIAVRAWFAVTWSVMRVQVRLYVVSVAVFPGFSLQKSCCIVWLGWGLMVKEWQSWRQTGRCPGLSVCCGSLWETPPPHLCSSPLIRCLPPFPHLLPQALPPQPWQQHSFPLIGSKTELLEITLFNRNAFQR